MKTQNLHQHKPGRSLLCLTFCLLLTLAAHAQAFAHDVDPAVGRPIHSASEMDYPPFCVLDEGGQATGFAVELLRASVEAMGQQITFRTGTWNEVKSLLENGQVDVLPLVGRTPEREEIFDFSFPYLYLRGAIVVRADETAINGMDDLRGRIVSVMKADNAEEYLRREDRGLQIRTTATFEDALRDLDEGRCDAVLIQRLVAQKLIDQHWPTRLRILKTAPPDFRQDFCFAVTKGDSHTLAHVNEGLARIISDGTYQMLKAKWFAKLEMKSHRRIVVGGDQNYPPFEYLDEHGQPAGYNVDLTHAIGRVLDLDVEIRLGPWTDIIQGLKDGEIEAIQGMFYSNERNHTFDFSQAHTINHCVAVTRDEDIPPESLGELQGKRIVVQKGDIMHDFALENGLGSQLTALDSQEDALRELAEGKHDCALVARMSALYHIEKNGWNQLDVGRQPLLSPEYCFAVPADRQGLLAELVEGLKVLDRTGEYQQIRQKWMGIYEKDSLPLSAILRYAAIVLLPLLLILAASLLWTWTLRKKVASRTALLRQSEEKHRALYENAPLPYQSLDEKGCFLDVNPAWLRATGYDREEVIGAWFGDFIHPDCLEDFRKSFTDLKSSGSISDREVTMRQKSGSLIRVSYEASIGRAGNGRFIQSYSVFRDITAQRLAEEALRESERSLRSTLDGLSANIALLDEQGVILLVNKAWRDFAAENGIPAEHVSEGVNYLQVCERSAGPNTPEAGRFAKGIRDVLSGTVNFFTQEYSYTEKNRERWFAGKVTIFPGDGPRRIVVAHEDITELKHALDSLRQSEARNRTLVETIPDLVWLKDINGVYLSCNPTFERFFGHSEAEIIGKTDYDYLDKELADFFRDNDRKALAANKPRVNEEWLTFAEGGYQGLFETVKTPMRDSSGHLIGVLGIARDITEHRKALDTLKERTSLLRAVVDNIPYEIWARDLDGYLFMENAPLVKHWGSLMGKRPEDSALTDEELAIWKNNNQRAMNGAIVDEMVSYQVDNEWRHFQNIVAPIRLDKEILGILGLNIDITERHQAEAKLRSTNELLGKTLESLNEAVFVIDANTRTIIQCNHAAQRVFGYPVEDLIGQSTEIIHVDHESFLRFGALSEPVLSRREPFHIEYRMKRKDGAIIDTENTVTAMNESDGGKGGVVSVVRDITERKQAENAHQHLEKQLRQAQKLESVGRLAGGVAHDFNNMLSVILGYTDLALMKLPTDNPAKSALKEVHKAAQRSADLTHQLLAFARKQTIAPKVLDLNETIASMLKMLGRMIGEDIELQWRPAEDLWPVKMDPAQLDQILANLVINSRDAIAGVGKITIETGKVVMDDDYCSHHLGSVPGRYAMIAVSDNGSGMDKETVANIFEPFFTTKPQGEGTGLGLATVYGIIKQNHGFINVYSEPGEGTTFRIYIPRLAETIDRPEEESEATVAKTGSETILVVEDEAPLLSLTTQILENLGYTVLAAGSPVKALEISRDHTEPIDLLLTDVIMPEMSGRDLCRELTSLRPGLKCIYMSGYTANIIAHHGILDEGVQFLQKPFTTRDLALRLRQSLDNGTERRDHAGRPGADEQA